MLVPGRCLCRVSTVWFLKRKKFIEPLMIFRLRLPSCNIILSGLRRKMTHKEVEEYVLSMPNAKLDYPFGEQVAVYKVNDKMFALIAEGKDPVRISLKCDPELSKLLREKYDEVMPGYHLNKKHWN